MAKQDVESGASVQESKVNFLLKLPPREIGKYIRKIFSWWWREMMKVPTKHNTIIQLRCLDIYKSWGLGIKNGFIKEKSSSKNKKWMHSLLAKLCI